MSFLMWGTIPDDPLLDLAGDGSLDDADGIASVAASMLADPRARTQIERFHALWLGFDQLPHAPALTTAMRTETSALLMRTIFDEPQAWTNLLTSSETFIDDDLATHYGVAPPGSNTPLWTSVERRQGILSHGSFLSMANNVADTSPTKRGKFIRNRLMCQPGPPLPEDDVMVDEPPDTSLAECKVDQYAQHRQGACAGCHAMMDPIGFGLERFDREGRYRTHDDGNPNCVIDGDGEIQNVGTFNGPAELSDLLLTTGLVEACAVQQLVQFAMGRPVDKDDDVRISTLTTQFAEGGHLFGELVMTLVTDPSFGFRKEVQ